MDWITVGPDGVAREALPEESTHMSSRIHSKLLLELALVKKELEDLKVKNKRLYEKHQQTLTQKVKWRDEALKAQGENPRDLHPKKVIIARDGEYWSLRTVDIEAGTEEEALAAALDYLAAREWDERTRLNRIKSLGHDEWQVEVLVALVAAR